MSVLSEILPGFGLSLVVVTVIIGFVYYPSNNGRHEFIFTYFTFSILIYFISGLLRDVQIGIGFGFGLLAVFTILRYRTERIPIKEMTYLFICVTVPFMNTLFMATRITFPELLIVNGIIVAGVFLAEQSWGVHYRSTKEIRYEKIELIKPEHYSTMLDDLRQRTGLDVERFEIADVDFLRDTARVIIYYHDLSHRN